jgi:hypothetical protein
VQITNNIPEIKSEWTIGLPLRICEIYKYLFCEIYRRNEKCSIFYQVSMFTWSERKIEKCTNAKLNKRANPVKIRYHVNCEKTNPPLHCWEVAHSSSSGSVDTRPIWNAATGAGFCAPHPLPPAPGRVGSPGWGIQAVCT